jgi:hypothetical protein
MINQSQAQKEETTNTISQEYVSPPSYEMTTWFETTYNSMLQMSPSMCTAWMNATKNEECKEVMATIIKQQWRDKFIQQRTAFVQLLLEALEEGHPCNDNKKYRALMGQILAA